MSDPLVSNGIAKVGTFFELPNFSRTFFSPFFSPVTGFIILNDDGCEGYTDEKIFAQNHCPEPAGAAIDAEANFGEPGGRLVVDTGGMDLRRPGGREFAQRSNRQPISHFHVCQVL